MGDVEQHVHSDTQGVPGAASDAEMMDEDTGAHEPVASGSGVAAADVRPGTIHAIHAEDDEEDDEDYHPEGPSMADEGSSSSEDEGDDGDDDDEALASGDEEVTAQVKHKRVNYKGM